MPFARAGEAFPVLNVAREAPPGDKPETNRRPVCPFSAGSETGRAKHGVPRVTAEWRGDPARRWV